MISMITSIPVCHFLYANAILRPGNLGWRTWGWVGVLGIGMVYFIYSINKPVQNLRNSFKILWINFALPGENCTPARKKNAKVVGGVSDKYQR